MLERLSQFLIDRQMITSDDKVLVAVSGGQDSIALAHALYELNLAHGIAHVNFGLRGQESEEDEQFVEQFARTLRLPFHLSSQKPNPEKNVQMEARAIRYAFFEALSKEHGYNKIAVAHHFQDKVETALINFVRGTGISGMRGIPHQNGKVIRPLIWADKAAIEAYLKHQNLAFRSDSSNASDKYLRNRIRKQIVPELLTIEKDANRRMQKSLEMIADDAFSIAQMAQSFVKASDTGFSISMGDLPIQSGATWLYHCIRVFGFNREQALDLFQSDRSGAHIASSTHTAVQTGSQVNVSSNLEHPLFVIEQPGYFEHDTWVVEVTTGEFQSTQMPRNNTNVWMDASKVNFPLTFRAPKTGDHFQPLGASYNVKLSEFLKDLGIKSVQKTTAIICCNPLDEPIWIVGHRLGDKVKTDDHTKSIVSISFKRQ